jgi:hypothetical protein
LTGHPLKGKECHGVGRNCELFDNVADWAYSEVRKYWEPNYEWQWKEAVLSRTGDLNGQFIVPLPYSEVKSISKSIANYVMRHFSPEKFRESQAIKGRKGGLAGSIEDKIKAGVLGGAISKGGGRPSLNQPWLELGLSRATYFRKKKAGLL